MIRLDRLPRVGRAWPVLRSLISLANFSAASIQRLLIGGGQRHHRLLAPRALAVAEALEDGVAIPHAQRRFSSLTLCDIPLLRPVDAP